MAKVKDGFDALATREQFIAVKKMDRPEFEAFLKTIYEKGHAKGRKAAECAAAEIATAERRKYKDEIITLLQNLSGIGKVTLKRINEVLSDWSD